MLIFSIASLGCWIAIAAYNLSMKRNDGIFKIVPAALAGGFIVKILLFLLK
jgi:hypothetical protein